MSDRIVYLNGRFLPFSEARVSPDDRGFLFGDGVYEVLRYHARTGLFRFEDHLRRLEHSLREIRLVTRALPRLRSILLDVVRLNELAEADALLYLQITRGVAPRMHPFPDSRVEPTLYVSAQPFVAPQRQWREGIRVALVPDLRWARCDIKSVALLPNVLASQVAIDRGAREAIFVRDGALIEGTHTAVAGVRGGRLLCHPAGQQLLPSVTQIVVLELCASLGVEVEERPIQEAELGRLDELLIMGTSSEVMPVVRVDRQVVGQGVPGALTRRLQSAFRALVD